MIVVAIFGNRNMVGNFASSEIFCILLIKTVLQPWVCGIHVIDKMHNDLFLSVYNMLLGSIFYEFFSEESETLGLNQCNMQYVSW